MTTRHFHHSFTDGPTVSHEIISLTTTQIADAAIREIVQISLSSAPFDVFLDQLLTPGDYWFRWIKQLGEIRETRTALSGLFGRFVARAYLTEHQHLSHFQPIRSHLPALNGWPALTVVRTHPGDLPDWVVASHVGANRICIAEAKGSHNTHGSGPALEAAKQQVMRINIHSGPTVLAVKRYAIATRWAVQGDPGLFEPYLSVDDPQDGERDATPAELEHLFRSTALGHFTALAEGAGLIGAANRLHEAKNGEPGHLRLPTAELIQIEGEAEKTRLVIAVAVVPGGIVAIPREGDIEEFRTGLLAVYGEKSMFLTVDVDLLRNIDAIVPVADAPSSPPLAAEPDRPFWTERRSYADGSSMIPARDVVIKRLPLDPVET